MKVIKHYCNRCEQFKGVFNMDILDAKTCIECGNALIPREVDMDIVNNKLLDRTERDVGG